MKRFQISSSAQAVYWINIACVFALFEGVFHIGVYFLAHDCGWDCSVPHVYQTAIYLWLSPLTLLFVALIYFLKSRILLAVYVLGEICLVLSQLKDPSVYYPPILAVYCVGIPIYGFATIAAVRFHRFERVENPRYRHAPKWRTGLGIVLAVLMTALNVSGSLPSSSPAGVVAGPELSQSQRMAIKQAGLIRPWEEIDLYYSSAPWSVTESGSILTPSAVIAFHTDEQGTVTVDRMPLHDVAAYVFVEESKFLGWADFVIEPSQATDHAPQTHNLPIDHENKSRFIEHLVAKVFDSPQ